MSDQASLLPEPAQADSPVRTDSCPCRKPPGSWGAKGWHWIVADDAWVDHQVARDVAALGGEVSPTERTEKAEESRKRWTGYLGVDMAIERCPGARRG